MTKVLDNSEVEEITEILENLEDEELAVKLLKDFNSKTRALGLLLLNKDKKLSHDEWKKECDQAKAELDQFLAHIRSLEV